MNRFDKCKICPNYSHCMHLKKGTVCDWKPINATVNNNGRNSEYLSLEIVIDKKDINKRCDIVLKK